MTHRSVGAAVASSRDFDEIQAYVMDLYEGVNAVESYVETDGQVVDRIPEDAHPAARRWGGLAVAPDQSPPQLAESEGPMTPDPRSQLAVSPPVRDALAARSAPAGTAPLYRTTLSGLCRFPNLAASSAKERPLDLAAPAGADAPVAALGKRYATGEQNMPCLGGASRINVWNPFAAASNQSTFSQQWYYTGLDGPVLQTVECGWHVDITRYGNATPHFFVFSTRRDGLRTTRFGGLRAGGVPAPRDGEPRQWRCGARDPVGRGIGERPLLFTPDHQQLGL